MIDAYKKEEISKIDRLYTLNCITHKEYLIKLESILLAKSKIEEAYENGLKDGMEAILSAIKDRE